MTVYAAYGATVWHGVTEEDVYAKSPPLANRLAVDARVGVEAVADAIIRALRRPI
jgi:hypothetical protein